MKQPVYVTGNAEKALNFSRHMVRNIEHHSADVDEIQTLNMHELVEHKARGAYEIIRQPVLVEDVSLGFRAWNNLPGPFIKFFVQTGDGLDEGVGNLVRMLNGFDDRVATASCTFAYFNGNDITFFEKSLRGTISFEPRGTSGFGFDRIFIPDGFDGKIAAELNEAEYDRYYSSIKPFSAIKQFLDAMQEQHV